MQQAKADTIKERVRDFFKKGHKSGNKIYDVQACLDQAKAIHRNQQAQLSRQHRPQNPTSYYNLAEILVKMTVAHRSGNCGEMAALSAYYVLKSEFLKRELVYIGEVNPPGDHAFCLVSSVKITKSLNFPSVTAFTQSKSAPSWMIIDPWLNVACSADDYITEGNIKLNKWTGEGKRVAWNGSQGWAWYPPSGEYQQAFVNAPLVLRPF